MIKMKKKILYIVGIVIIVVALVFAWIYFLDPHRQNKTLDEKTVKVGTMYSVKKDMCDLSFKNVKFSTKNQKIAVVSHGVTDGMLMPIHAGKTEIVMTGTYKDKKYTRTLPITVKATKNVQVGCDVSAWNTHFDATKVKKYNLNFVMLRLGVGHDVDAQSRLKAIALKQNKVKMGAYWYLASDDRKSLLTTKDATNQAKTFVRMLNNMEGQKMAMPVFLDLESPTLVASKKPHAHMEKLVKAFMKVLKDAGYDQVGIYANRSFMINYLSTDYFSQFKDLVWYARYGHAKSGPYSDGSRSYLWQTGDHYKSAVVNDHDLDLDYLYLS